MSHFVRPSMSSSFSTLPLPYRFPHLGLGRVCRKRRKPYLRDALAVLPPVEDSPGNAAGVLALEEERLGLAVLEPEDLAVATDVQLTLQSKTRSELLSFGPR